MNILVSSPVRLAVMIALALSPTPWVSQAEATPSRRLQPTVAPRTGAATPSGLATKAPPPVTNSSVVVTDIGPEGGTIPGLDGFVIDPTNPNAILAPTIISVFKSTDAGKSWHPANVGLVSGGVTVPAPNIRRDPSQPHTVYAAGDFGLFRSTDFGDHWTRLSTVGLSDIAVSPADPSVILSVCAIGGFVGGAFCTSTDGGVTMVKQTGTGLPESGLGFFVDFTNVAISPLDPQTVFVVDRASGVYKSTDGGATFTLLDSTSDLTPGQVFLHPSQRDTIFLEAFSGPTALYRSTDGGATFSVVTGGLPGGVVQFVAFDPVKPSTIYAASTEGLQRSTDEGLNFTPLGLTRDQLDADRGGAIVVNLDPVHPNTLYVNTPEGNFKSTNGGRSFSAINVGFRATTVTDVAIDHDKQPSLYVVADFALFRTRDRGKSYEQLLLPPGAFPTAVAVAPTDKNLIVVTALGAGTLRSTDGGLTWSPALGNSPEGGRIVIDPSDARNVYILAGVLYRSTDGAQTFTRPPGGDGVFVSLTSTLAIDPELPHVLYVSGGNGLFGPPLLVKSTDAGQSFSAALTTFGVVNAIVVDPHNSNVVYAGGIFQFDFGKPYPYPQEINFVVRSTDGGVTFAPSDEGVGLRLFAGVTGMVIDPTDSARLYLSHGGDLFETLDGANTWSLLASIDAGIRNTVTIDPSTPRRLYLGGSSLLQVDIPR